MTATRETPPAASATLHGIAAIVLWSSLAVLALGTAVLPPFQVLATSFGIAGMAGMLALVTKGRAGLAVLRQPVGAFALATVALYGYHALYFVAFRHAPALEANLVNYLWPLLIVVFAALLPGERPRAGAVAGTLIGLAGVVVMLTRGQSLALDPAHRAGYLAAFAAALTWAAYSVLNRRYRDVPSAAVFAPCLVVAVLALATHLAFEATVAPTPGQWGMLVLMGLGPGGAAFWLWDSGTKRGNLALLGTLSYAAPLLSTLLLLASGRVEAHPAQAVAVVLLVLGAWISVRSTRVT